MTFLGIQQDLSDRLGYAQAPATPVARRLKRFINDWHRRVVSSPGMAPLRRVIITQASIAAQQTYGLVLNEIKFFTEATTDRRLYPKTLAWYRERFPDPANFTGTPLYWVPLGHSRIHTRPSAAAELFVKSTSASDTGTAYVEVIRSTGYRRSLSVTMTGVTAVSLGAAITDVVDVVDFYISAAAVGTVTLHMTSGSGTELSRIPIGATVGRFLRYALAPTPASAITYTIDGIADLVDLANDTDEPLIGMDFHDILVNGALYDEYVQLGRLREAGLLMHGGNPNGPTRESVQGRIRQLRASLIEWSEGDDSTERTFDESINLPIA